MESVTGWRKASYSSTNGGNCVETGNAVNGIAVRDTTDREGPQLNVKPDSWAAFMGRLKK